MTLEPQEEVVVEDPAPAPREGEPVPPPIEPPVEPESLAEQVYREAHTVPESTGPADYVPNRANIRPPEDVVVQEDPPVVEDESVETQAALPETSVERDEEWHSAKDLIAEAEAAETDAELDAIEAQAEGRKTVLDAVAKAREEMVEGT